MLSLQFILKHIMVLLKKVLKLRASTSKESFYSACCTILLFKSNEVVSCDFLILCNIKRPEISLLDPYLVGQYLSQHIFIRSIVQ